MKKIKTEKRIWMSENDYALVIQACEYGYKACEKGWNLDKTLFELSQILNKEN